MQLKSYCGFDLRVFPITSIATIRKKIPKSRIVLLIILKMSKIQFGMIEIEEAEAKYADNKLELSLLMYIENNILGIMNEK